MAAAAAAARVDHTLGAAMPDDAAVVSADTSVATAEEEAQLADEQENYRRYQEAEREILDVLDEEELDDATRKRRLMRVFDRFRYEYAQLSALLRENIRAQRKIMDKCVEMKNELVFAALKVKTNQHVQDEEMKNLVFYRDECEIAWKERKMSEERERDAMKIIDTLKSEIEDLQGRVKALVATVLPPTDRLHRSQLQAGDDGVHVGGGLCSPSKVVASLKQQQQQRAEGRGASRSMTSPSPHCSHPQPMLDFDEWKRANRIWDPRAAGVASRGTTPSLEALLEIEKRQEITRCVSVPSLQPTAMEKAATAVATLPLSPSPTRKSRKPQTAVGFMRATTSSPSRRASASLPHV